MIALRRSRLVGVAFACLVIRAPAAAGMPCTDIREGSPGRLVSAFPGFEPDLPLEPGPWCMPIEGPLMPCSWKPCGPDSWNGQGCEWEISVARDMVLKP